MSLTGALWAWLLLSCLQGALMVVDETCFHRNREMPLWERVGHPIDTFLFGACLAIAVLVPPRGSDPLYWGLAALSSLMVTKDEPIHSRLCSPAESWLHAVLFILHPSILILVGAPDWGIRALAHAPGPLSALSRRALSLQLAGSCLFGTAQILYWGYLYGRTRGGAHQQRVLR